MGFIYKLESKIVDFILESKKANSALSCRQLSRLILDKFQIELSKSSVNAIIRNAGLSQPIGRRRTKRKYTRRKPLIPPPLVAATPELAAQAPALALPEKPAQIIPEKIAETPVFPVEPELPAELECTGAILLKAGDYLIDASTAIKEAIQSRLSRKEDNLLALTEALIYLPLFKETNAISKFWPLMDKKLALEDIHSFLEELQGIKPVGLDVFRIFSTIFQEVRCIKVTLSDGSSLYLDGQLHTVWSTPHIPYDFYDTLHNVKGYIKNYFQADSPVVLFMAPGYDTPTKEFFDFILGLDIAQKKISRLTLYGNKFEEIETMPLEKDRRRFFVFGLWPWQFGGYRKLNSIGNFRPFRFEPLKQDFYLANIEIALSQPNSSQTIALRGCGLKKNLNEKIRLLILSNLPEEKTPQDLANIYLSHWPNLEEAFRDFSRKIELFTYTADSQHFFSTDNLPLGQNLATDIKGLFCYYLKALDLYVRWHFLPAGYENKVFSFTEEQFYNLNCRFKKQTDIIYVTFLPQPGYPLLKDLQYACRRINERQILFSQGEKLWCEA